MLSCSWARFSLEFEGAAVNESLTHYYKHHEDYIMSFLLKDLYRAVDIFGKALKIKILHKVALGMALTS